MGATFCFQNQNFDVNNMLQNCFDFVVWPFNSQLDFPDAISMSGYTKICFEIQWYK